MKNHPTTFTLLRYIRDELTETEREHLEHHTANCRQCLSELAALYQVEKEVAEELPDGLEEKAIELEEYKAGTRRPELKDQNNKPKRWYWNAAAGVLLLLAVGALLVIIWPEPEQPNGSISEFRSEGVIQTIRPLEPKDGAIISQPPTYLEWEENLSAVRYRISLYRENSTQLLNTSTDYTRLMVADTLSLISGNTYLWQVDALNINNQTITTGLFHFRIQPDSTGK